jgi:hypothetical protein
VLPQQGLSGRLRVVEHSQHFLLMALQRKLYLKIRQLKLLLILKVGIVITNLHPAHLLQQLRVIMLLLAVYLLSQMVLPLSKCICIKMVLNGNI